MANSQCEFAPTRLQAKTGLDTQIVQVFPLFFNVTLQFVKHYSHKPNKSMKIKTIFPEQMNSCFLVTVYTTHLLPYFSSLKFKICNRAVKVEMAGCLKVYKIYPTTTMLVKIFVISIIAFVYFYLFEFTQ